MTFYLFSYVSFVCEYGCVWLFHEPWHANGSQRTTSKSQFFSSLTQIPMVKLQAW